MKKSIRNLLKRKAQEPRSMDEIKKEYFELSTRAGQAQYQAYVHNKEVAEINKRLELINHEAAERTKLDEAAKASAPVENKEGA